MNKPFANLHSSRRSQLCCALLLTTLLGACSSNDDDDTELMGALPGADNEQPGGGSMPSPTNELVPRRASTSANGDIYADVDGNTLYTRYADEPGNTNCDANCLQNFEPLSTEETRTGISGDFDVITRADGTSQWTLHGYPLYRFRGDAATGDVGGEGFDNEWALARPNPTDSGSVADDEALVAQGTVLADGSSDTRIDRNGFTLYTFANDSAGVSTCNGGCATTWPPLYADTGLNSGDDSLYSIIVREDGTRQVAYRDMPLYFYQGDSAAGEDNGTALANWEVARP